MIQKLTCEIHIIKNTLIEQSPWVQKPRVTKKITQLKEITLQEIQIESSHSVYSSA